MSTQLIASNLKDAFIYGPESGMYTLPNPHAIVVQSTYGLNFPYLPYNLADYLDLWSQELTKQATVRDYATNLVNFMINTKTNSSITESDEIIAACRHYLGQDIFQKHFDEDPVISLDQMEERPELADFDFVAAGDLIDIERAKEELVKFASVKPLDQVEEVALHRAIKEALESISEFNRQDLGEEVLNLIESHGALMLRWYRTNFEVLQTFTIVGFGATDLRPAAIKVVFGGSLYGNPLVTLTNPFAEARVFDSTYDVKTFNEKLESLEFLHGYLRHWSSEFPQEFHTLARMKEEAGRLTSPSPRVKTSFIQLTPEGKVENPYLSFI